MKLLFKTALPACFLALAACGGQGDDSLGENVAEQADTQADAMEEQADNATSERQEDALEANASVIRETGEAKEDAIDEADVKVNQQ